MISRHFDKLTVKSTLLADFNFWKKVMPKTSKNLSAEELQLQKIRDECYDMVNKSSYYSGAVAAVPIPGLDVANDISILTRLLPKINKKFGLSPEQIDDLNPQLKELTLVAITKVGTNLIGKYVTREAAVKAVTAFSTKAATTAVTKTGLKYIPLLGPVLSGGISYGAMRYVGRAHVNDCYKIALSVMEQSKEITADAARTIDVEAKVIDK